MLGFGYDQGFRVAFDKGIAAFRTCNFDEAWAAFDIANTIFKGAANKPEPGKQNQRERRVWVWDWCGRGGGTLGHRRRFAPISRVSTILVTECSLGRDNNTHATLFHPLSSAGLPPSFDLSSDPLSAEAGPRGKNARRFDTPKLDTAPVETESESEEGVARRRITQI